MAELVRPPPAGPLTVVVVLPAGRGSVSATPAGGEAEGSPLSDPPPCADPAQGTNFRPSGPFKEAPGAEFGSPGGIPRFVGPRFLAYWRIHGGLAVNGYPLSSEFEQQLEDGKTYTVQYFERVRLEYHPENSPPYDVLIGQFGRHFHPADPPAAQLTDATFFAETGHNLRAGFQDYWRANGGLAQFGYPLTEEFTETLEDGNSYTVQYFERARFEWHPNNPEPYRVLLGQFGQRVLAELGH